MKKTISILLSIFVMFSVFTMPISVEADENDEECTIVTDYANEEPISISVGEDGYNEKLKFVNNNHDNDRLYKITIQESCVYKFRCESSDDVSVDGYLYKEDDYKKQEYLKYSNEHRYDFKGIYQFEITHYFKKGETVYFLMREYQRYNDEKSLNFIIEQKKYMVAKNGIIYSRDNKEYCVYDNYIDNNQKANVKIENEINYLPVTSIDRNAFERCKSINSISIPSNVKEIGYESFALCRNLKSVTFDNGIGTLYNDCFDNTSITKIHFPKSVKDINGISKIITLNSITIDKNNPYYTVVNGVLFNKDKSKLCCYPSGKKESSYTIPYGVETISRYAFSYSLIESVTFPTTVKVIDYSSFSQCYKLKDVNLNEGLTKIDEFAFNYCYNISYLKLPSTIKTIANRCFSFTDIRTIEIPENVESFDFNCFSWCSNVNSVIIKGKDTKIVDDEPYVLDITNIFAPESSTAEAYATKNYMNFISTTLADGKTCKEHRFVADKCVKKPDCLNYGVFTTKCAICGKVGDNIKVIPSEHRFNFSLCRFCGYKSYVVINAELNKQYNETILSSNSVLTFFAPYNGTFCFNLNIPNKKFAVKVKIYNRTDDCYTEDNIIVEKSCKKEFTLKKGQRIETVIRILASQNQDDTLYKPSKFSAEFTCKHSFNSTVVKPTYTAEGYTLCKCSICGYSYKDKKTPKLKLLTPSNVKLKGGKKSLTVSYKKVVKASGYQIQYGLNRNFKSAKIIKINKNSIVKTLIKKLTSNKKYYVRVRSYVVEKNKTAYSSWSGTNNVKVK